MRLGQLFGDIGQVVPDPIRGAGTAQATRSLPLTLASCKGLVFGCVQRWGRAY